MSWVFERRCLSGPTRARTCPSSPRTCCQRWSARPGCAAPRRRPQAAGAALCHPGSHRPFLPLFLTQTNRGFTHTTATCRRSLAGMTLSSFKVQGQRSNSVDVGARASMQRRASTRIKPASPTQDAEAHTNGPHADVPPPPPTTHVILTAPSLRASPSLARHRHASIAAPPDAGAAQQPGLPTLTISPSAARRVGTLWMGVFAGGAASSPFRMAAGGVSGSGPAPGQVPNLNLHPSMSRASSARRRRRKSAAGGRGPSPGPDGLQSSPSRVLAGHAAAKGGKNGKLLPAGFAGERGDFIQGQNVACHARRPPLVEAGCTNTAAWLRCLPCRVQRQHRPAVVPPGGAGPAPPGARRAHPNTARAGGAVCGGLAMAASGANG